MRVATIFFVLIIHVVFFLIFATLRRPVAPAGKQDTPAAAVFFLPPNDTTRQDTSQPPTIAQAAQPPRPKRPTAAPAKSAAAIATPQREPAANAITAPAAPDWRHELQIAANNAIESQERRRHQTSPLAPHDFSGVKPGSTDDSKPRFGWNHAATHRIEEIPTGGLLINISDRCVIAWAILPLAFCRIGKIPVRGDLFEHMQDPPPAGEPEVP
ncbi:MAG: hypothetical protein ACJ8R9_09110 [Steroidobacteraceae bacterium]